MLRIGALEDKQLVCLVAGGAFAAIVQDPLSGGDAWFASYDQQHGLCMISRCREEMPF